MGVSPESLAYQSYKARLESYIQAPVRDVTQNKRKHRRVKLVPWPHALPTAENMAKAGFFFAPTKEARDNVRCFMCNVDVEGWEPSDLPVEEHINLSQDCPWAILAVQPQSRRQPTRQRHGKTQKDTEDAIYRSRLLTFYNWPHAGKRGWRPTPEHLASAGFHYAPNYTGDDTIECAQCGVSLNSWERADDGLVEHQEAQPCCPFLLSQHNFNTTTDLEADISSVTIDDETVDTVEDVHQSESLVRESEGSFAPMDSVVSQEPPDVANQSMCSEQTVQRSLANSDADIATDSRISLKRTSSASGLPNVSSTKRSSHAENEDENIENEGNDASLIESAASCSMDSTASTSSSGSSQDEELDCQDPETPDISVTENALGPQPTVHASLLCSTPSILHSTLSPTKILTHSDMTPGLARLNSVSTPNITTPSANFSDFSHRVQSAEQADNLSHTVELRTNDSEKSTAPRGVAEQSLDVNSSDIFDTCHSNCLDPSVSSGSQESAEEQRQSCFKDSHIPVVDSTGHHENVSGTNGKALRIFPVVRLAELRTSNIGTSTPSAPQNKVRALGESPLTSSVRSPILLGRNVTGQDDSVVSSPSPTRPSQARSSPLLLPKTAAKEPGPEGPKSDELQDSFSGLCSALEREETSAGDSGAQQTGLPMKAGQTATTEDAPPGLERDDSRSAGESSEEMADAPSQVRPLVLASVRDLIQGVEGLSEASEKYLNSQSHLPAAQWLELVADRAEKDIMGATEAIVEVLEGQRQHILSALLNISQ